MKRVMICAYYFPPDGGAGTQRPVKFCKYLREFGWEPIVLTRGGVKSRGRWDPEDASLLRDIGDDLDIRRVCVRDSDRMSWVREALPVAQNVIAEGVDAIVVSMPPYDTADLGANLFRSGNVPVVFDLRDPWAFDGSSVYRSRWHWRREYKRMHALLRSCSGVIANTGEAATIFRDVVPEGVPVVAIPNGFDAQDFESPGVSGVSKDREESFLLVHTGTFHSRGLYEYRGLSGCLRALRHFRVEPVMTSGRSPFHLLAAARRLQIEEPELYNRLDMVFVGHADEWTRRCVEESGVSDRVTLTGYLSHDESVRWLSRADALFLPMWGLPKGNRSRISPGKIYEYLASNKRILAALPEGDAREIVKESGRSVVVDPCDTAGIADALRQVMSEAGNVKALPASLRRFERRELTKKLAEFLELVSTSDDVDSRKAVRWC